MDGEKYEIVDSFCYLGDMLSTERGADAAVLARVRCVLRKFRELEHFLTYNVDYVKACTRLVVEGKGPVGRPTKTWQNTSSADMHLMKVDPRDTHDQRKRVGVTPIQ